MPAPRSLYLATLEELRAEPRAWLVTGCAGFIGSHLVEALLRLEQRVVGLDNLSTGAPRNLDAVKDAVSRAQWARFAFREGSVAEIGACREASDGADFVLHLAGFISVPLSIEDPIACHDTNVTGMLNVLIAARDNRAHRVVFASSSAVYGDDARMPKIEAEIGRALSPYGASKLMDEIYARQFSLHYGLETVGLRYFNIFGPRQNPTGGYAAVIPQWITRRVRGEECAIHGEGGITRDFCHVANVVQANLLAATTRSRSAVGEAFNIGNGAQTTLAELYAMISQKLAALGIAERPVLYGPARAGDIAHSGADISRAIECLGYAPEVSVEAGLEETVRWYAEQK